MNKGEDNLIFDIPHLTLLAAKIGYGCFAVPRCRVDKAMWGEGLRNESRFFWLSPPEAAYNAARKHNSNMQNCTCNWFTAWALRDAVEERQGVCQLPTVASIVHVEPHGQM